MALSRTLDVTVDHSLCVGNGTCLTIAPRTFAHNADRQSTVTDPAASPEAAILEAAANCPMAAIRVAVTETGAQLFP
jgi:ferredoxin